MASAFTCTAEGLSLRRIVIWLTKFDLISDAFPDTAGMVAAMSIVLYSQEGHQTGA